MTFASQASRKRERSWVRSPVGLSFIFCIFFCCSSALWARLLQFLSLPMSLEANRATQLSGGTKEQQSIRGGYLYAQIVHNDVGNSMRQLLYSCMLRAVHECMIVVYYQLPNTFVSATVAPCTVPATGTFNDLKGLSRYWRRQQDAEMLSLHWRRAERDPSLDV